ncbi:BA14K family protein [Oscillospiraceae bacterium CLA-AA-H269]|nr:BA14K family protein [Hominicoprocola fusiformis]
MLVRTCSAVRYCTPRFRSFRAASNLAERACSGGRERSSCAGRIAFSLFIS